MILTQQSAFDAYPVTPNDSADLPGGRCKSIYLGGSGDVAVVMQGGQSVVFSGMAAGVIYNIAARRILAAETTATDILALY